MKSVFKKLLCITCLLTLITAQKSDATLSDFSQRFGANSHIINVPLWFKRPRVRGRNHSAHHKTSHNTTTAKNQKA